MGAWRHILAILVLPGMVLGVIPLLLLRRGGVDTLGLWGAMPLLRAILPLLGLLFAGLGLALMFTTIRLFATVGRGTLAPWDPTQRLVVRGVYRHVRNPMITGVLCVLLGEAIATASAPILGWFATFALINATYIPLSEEPGLVRRFGDDYARYRQNVPRWIPRRTPWESDLTQP